MKWLVLASVAVALLLPRASWAQVTDSRWIVLFEKECAVCHGTTSVVPNAVSRQALRAFSPERVLKALTTGAMAPNASALSDEEKRGIAVFLTGRPFGNAADRSAAAMPNRCASGMPMGDPVRRAAVERHESRCHDQRSLSTGRGSGADGRAATAAPAQVGVRLSRRQLGPGPAYGGWGSGVRG